MKKIIKLLNELLKNVIVVSVFWVPFFANLNASASESSAKEAASQDFVAVKNFGALVKLGQSSDIRHILASSQDLSQLKSQLDQRVRSAHETCNADATCYLDKIQLTKVEIEQASVALKELLRKEPALRVFVSEQLRKPGNFPKFNSLTDEAFLEAVWLESTAGIINIYSTYGYGLSLRYPKIDAGLYKRRDKRFGLLLGFAVETEVDSLDRNSLFFGSWMQLALDLLVIQQRQEAAGYEPLELGENARALERAKTIKWKGYEYSAILILGAGNRQQEVGLATIGAFRNRLGVRRFKDGLAPFIIVSGGNVHPNRTPDNEALLMKQDLIKRYGVPKSAILVEPHARHTTTNLRNAARIIYGLNAPETKPLLLTTSISQSRYVESDKFRIRNEEELGFQPQEIQKRLSEFDLVMLPNPISLHRNYLDPLDP